MKALIAEWNRTGQNITAIVYYMVSLFFAAAFALLALFKLTRSHETAGACYALLAFLSLVMFLYTNDRIRQGTIGRPIGKGFHIVVFGFVLGFTALYFTDGGLSGGGIFFFIIALVMTPCFFKTRLALQLMLLEAAAYLCNVALSLSFPYSVDAAGYDIFDLLVPFAVSAVFLCAFSVFYIFAYHRQKASLSDLFAEVKNAAETKSRFLDHTTMGLRAPISTILSMDEMILREEERPEIIEYAAQIRRSANALLSVINDLSDYTKIQDNEMEITKGRYDLSSLINDMVTIAAEMAREKSLEFQVYVDRDIPRMLIGDEFHIRQIILNILNNAIKYTERGGVNFRASFDRLNDDEIQLRFAIADTGIGIRKEDLEQIFVPFEHLSDERQDTEPGTGLGLSIVRALLELMGSTLDIHSIPGQGSLFSFGIRQQVRGEETIGDYARAWREAGVHNAEGRTITFTAPDAHLLVVDDTPVNLVVIQNLLRDTAVHIDTANSGEDALPLIRENSYDLIFIDHRMPGMDGIETFRAMKRMTNSPNAYTPVIALTANAVAGARQTYLDEGFRDYLPKPVDSIRLKQMIRANLPREKVMDYTGTAEVSTTAAQGASDYRALTGIDYEAAVKNCGSEEIFAEALSVFYDTIAENADKIEGYAKEGDWHNYTVLVHALKSSARLVGALTLSADALHLEEAGNAEDEQEIREKTPALLADYRAYLEHLAPVCKKADASTLPEISGEEIALLYQEITRYADDFDLDALDEVIKNAEKYRFPENEQKRFERVKIGIRNADWGALKEALP